jgi:hypothetical protein
MVSEWSSFSVNYRKTQRLDWYIAVRYCDIENQP